MSKNKTIKYGYLFAGEDEKYKKCKVVCEINDMWVCVVPESLSHCLEDCGICSDILNFGKVGETFFYDELDAKMEAVRIKNSILTRDHNDLSRELYDLKSRVKALENRPWWRFWK